MPIEREIKLHLASAFFPQISEHPLVKEHTCQGPIKKHLQSTYFDTPDLRIVAQGMGLRIRRVDAHWIQTLKGDSSGGSGLHRRQEWESEIEKNTPVLDRLPKEAKVGVLKEAELERYLIPVFETDFWRTTWCLQSNKGSIIELALDSGDIYSQGCTEPLSELELELKVGQEEELYTVALRLAEAFPVMVEHASKAERGYRLYRRGFFLLKVPGPVPLGKAATPEKLKYWLARLEYGERLVLERKDSRGIEHLRIAAEALQRGLTQKASEGDTLLWEDLAWFISKLQQRHDFNQVRSWLGRPRYSRLLLRLGAYLASLEKAVSS